MRTKLMWAAAFGVCVAASIILPMLWQHSLVDLKVYRLGGRTLLDNASTLYDARLAGLPFTYPPFAAVVMVPFALLPWSVAISVWTVGTVVSLVFVWRLSLGRGVPSALLLAVVAGSLLLEPVRETLGFGQVNLMLCALVLYDLLDLKHSRRGMWIGLAAGVKLTPLVFLGLLVFTRQWKALLYSAGSFALTVVVGFVVSPHSATEYWTSLVSDTTRIGGLAFSSNQSWNASLIRLTGDLDGDGVVWMALVLVTVLGGLWFSRLLWLRDDRLASVSICALVGLLCSPVSWSHHWVWVLPLGVCLVRAVSGRWRYVVGVLWYGLFALAPIWWPPNHDNRELTWSFGDELLGNTYLIWSLAGVVLLAVNYRRQVVSAAVVAPSTGTLGQ